MGIYPSDNIQALRIYNFIDDMENILFEIKFNCINNEIKQKIKLFYENNLNNKNDLHYAIYTECSDTYGDEKYFIWLSITQELFLQKFI
jgi:hypothetical protein